MTKKEKAIHANIEFITVREANGEPFHSPSKIYASMKAEAEIDRECCWVLHVNSRNRIIYKELVSMGTVNASLVAPREVFRRAIIQGSSAIVVVHNHPSGDPDPSMDDIKICTRLIEAAEIIDIKLLDFIVIGTDGYVSFMEKNVGGFK